MSISIGPMDRAEIVNSMCITMRHDFGLIRPPSPGDPDEVIACDDMSYDEQSALASDIGKVFDHHVAPIIEMYNVQAERIRKLEAQLAGHGAGAGPGPAEPVFAMPEAVKVWYEAKLDHVDAVDAYNTRLDFVRKHEPLGTSVNTEYQAMHNAERRCQELMGSMFLAFKAMDTSRDTAPAFPWLRLDMKSEQHTVKLTHRLPQPPGCNSIYVPSQFITLDGDTFNLQAHAATLISSVIAPLVGMVDGVPKV